MRPAIAPLCARGGRHSTNSQARLQVLSQAKLQEVNKVARPERVVRAPRIGRSNRNSQLIWAEPPRKGRRRRRDFIPVLNVPTERLKIFVGFSRKNPSWLLRRVFVQFNHETRISAERTTVQRPARAIGCCEMAWRICRLGARPRHAQGASAPCRQGRQTPSVPARRH